MALVEFGRAYGKRLGRYVCLHRCIRSGLRRADKKRSLFACDGNRAGKAADKNSAAGGDHHINQRSSKTNDRSGRFDGDRTQDRTVRQGVVRVILMWSSRNDTRKPADVVTAGDSGGVRWHHRCTSARRALEATVDDPATAAGVVRSYCKL